FFHISVANHSEQIPVLEGLPDLSTSGLIAKFRHLIKWVISQVLVNIAKLLTALEKQRFDQKCRQSFAVNSSVPPVSDVPGCEGPTGENGPTP
ncbi:MAG: hypothetical protein LBT40_05260, partial [Deltaproteobacteria bacterium]|nr:hypothetical protein [Deltaproteobacteria bacterium]